MDVELKKEASRGIVVEIQPREIEIELKSPQQKGKRNLQEEYEEILARFRQDTLLPNLSDAKEKTLLQLELPKMKKPMHETLHPIIQALLTMLWNVWEARGNAILLAFTSTLCTKVNSSKEFRRYANSLSKVCKEIKSEISETMRTEITENFTRRWSKDIFSIQKKFDIESHDIDVMLDTLLKKTLQEAPKPEFDQAQKIFDVLLLDFEKKHEKYSQAWKMEKEKQRKIFSGQLPEYLAPPKEEELVLTVSSTISENEKEIDQELLDSIRILETMKLDFEIRMEGVERASQALHDSLLKERAEILSATLMDLQKKEEEWFKTTKASLLENLQKLDQKIKQIQDEIGIASNGTSVATKAVRALQQACETFLDTNRKSFYEKAIVFLQ